MESKELASLLRCIIDDTERIHTLGMVRLSDGKCVSAYDEKGDYPSTADYKRLQELYPELEEMDYLTLWKPVIDTPDEKGSATLSYAVEFWNENHGEGDTDRSSLEADLNEHYESIGSQYSEYERKLKNLNWIEENPTVDVSYTSKIRSSTIKLLPLWPDGRSFIASDLPILFDAAVTSASLPILMLRAEGNDFYKVWASRLEDERSIDKVNQLYEEFQRQEHIQFMLLVLRGGRATIVTWYDDGFTVRSLSAKSTTRNVDEDVWLDVKRTFLEAFSELRLDWDNVDRTVIYADATVRDHTLDLWSLYWLAWMSDALPLTPHEQSNNFAERSAVFYHYLVPTIGAAREADVRFQVLNIEGGGTVFSNIRAPNMRAYNETLAIIGSIVNAVKSAEPRVQGLFSEYEFDLAARESAPTTTISKIVALKARAGEFFSRPNYTRKCSKARQPVIVDGPEVKGYEVGKFPLTRTGEPDDPRSFYYICPDSKTPHPGVVNMNDDATDPNLRYLPCCFRTPQIGAPRSKYEVYRAMVEGREITASSKGKGSKVLLVKVPGPGSMGEVPQDLERLVRYILEDETLVVRRYGVEAGKNAFLRSVLFALGAPSSKYKMVKNLRDPELYKLRGAIADSIQNDNRTYWAQEWGLEKEALLAEIRDEKQRFDYYRYARVLEVYLDVNILLFRIERGVRVTLEKPEYTGTYYRPWDSSKSTVILTTENGESYEPLNYGTDFVFTPEDGAAFASFFVYTAEETKISYLNEIYPNHHVELQDIIGMLVERDDVKIKGQHINDSGKCYAITTDRGRIDFPPCMPFLLPLAQEEVKENTREVKWWDDFIQGINTDPVAMLEEDGNYSWLFIQLLRNPVSTDLKGGESTTAHNMLRLRSDSATLEQILTWLARILAADRESSLETLTSTVRLGAVPYEYDFIQVPKQLPETKDIKEALSLVESWNTGLASGGVLLSFHARFTPILKRLISEKYRIAKARYAPGQERPVIRTINAYSLTSDSDSLTFAGKDAYVQWLPWLNATYAGMESTVTTVNSIDEIKPWQLLPVYFWEHDVLLQQTTTRAKAMEISRQWDLEGKNPGYNPVLVADAEDPMRYEELVWSSERQEIIAFPEKISRGTGYYIVLETGYCVAILPLKYEE